MPKAEYLTYIFDCDGVILDSNRIKTEAFFKISLRYGKRAATLLVDYHKNNGGVSRYKKIEYFLSDILQVEEAQMVSERDRLLNDYAKEVQIGLMQCDIAPGIEEFRKKTLNSRWLVVSGGDQIELKDVFKRKNLDNLFDGGIYGSPDTKDEILRREVAIGNIQHPAVYLGDSKYDYAAASKAEIDFVFLHGWSEVSDWKEWVALNKINAVGSLYELCNSGFCNKET